MPKPRSCWLHELRWPEVEAHLATDDVVLVPIGATEQHGRHLPLLVDTGWAAAMSEGAARATGALVAPPLQVGWSPHHMGYPGTLTLRADTLRRVALDVGESLVHHGFRRVIYVNGNRIANLPPIEIAIVELKNRTGAYAGIADAGLIAKRGIKDLCDATDGGLDHAGEIESSFALHWAPDHVDMSEAPPPRLANRPPSPRFAYAIELDPALGGDSVSLAVAPGEYRAATAPTGAPHDTSTASAAKGARAVELLVEALASFIAEVRRVELGAVHAAAPF